jgi:hypothetical protein
VSFIWFPKEAEQMLGRVVFAILDMAKNRLEKIVHEGNTAVAPLGGQLRERPRADEHRCVCEYVDVDKVQCWLGSPEIKDFRNTPRPLRHSAPFPERREVMTFQQLTSNVLPYQPFHRAPQLGITVTGITATVH